MNKKIRTLFILGCLLFVSSRTNAVLAQIDVATLEIFRAANLADSGDKSNNLKTLRIKNSNSKSEENITLFEVTSQKLRVEKRTNNKLEIRQVEGNEGWKWIDSKKEQLSEAEIKALKIQLCYGYLGRSECIKKISLGETSIDEKTKPKHFPLTFDNAAFNYEFNDRIEENAKDVILVNSKSVRRVIYDDFRTVNGIVFPHLRTVNKLILNEQNILTKTEEVITKTSSIEVNPEFTASDWAVPN